VKKMNELSLRAIIHMGMQTVFFLSEPFYNPVEYNFSHHVDVHERTFS
jgi:hypothetical protein